MKKLNDILYKVPIEGIFGNPKVKVSSITFDSRKIKKNSLFIAQKGTKSDGNQFISQAIKNGAIAIVCESIPDLPNANITFILVKNASKALGIISSNFFSNPSKELSLIGITGTNGKTTIVSLLYELFSSLGLESGLISTVKVKFSNKEFENKYTTPDSISINNYLRQMVDLDIKYCFMEVSSHGISQHRIEGLDFSGGVFTNITHDHLDYHGSFINYRNVKKQFFDILPKNAFALTNLDDKNGSFMIQNTKAKKYTYSINQYADYKLKILECQFSGMLLKIQNQEVWTNLVGNFNSQNLLAVYAVADIFQIPKLNILKNISLLKCVEGRFQTFISEDEVTVIIDYAHTPNALENILETINKIRTRNETFLVLVGCGGNRDREKRPIMGKIASELCDKVIFTSDNPRNEDPSQIISEMIQGVAAENYKKIVKISLREEAILMSKQLAKGGDIVLIAGKGHESYQEIEGNLYPFNDFKIAKKIFLKMD